MVATARGRLEGRLLELALADPAELGAAALGHVEEAARLAHQADRELADAGVDVIDRAELLVATAGLQALAEQAAWTEVSARSGAIARRLRQRRAARRGPSRRLRAVLRALLAASAPWPMCPTVPPLRR
jgi:hypothetical protein